jgi:proline iminopeptidase
MGMNNFLGILGSDKAYKRLFTQVMKNYNDDFVDISALAVDFENLKAAPINKTRPEIIKYPLLQKLIDPKFKITIVYGNQDIYKASKEFVISRFPTAEVITIQNCGHIPWLHNPAEHTKILKTHYE